MNKQNLFGSISVGKYADMLILEKNPLDNIDNLQSVGLVIINGEQVNIIKTKNERENKSRNKIRHRRTEKSS